jgi:surfactin synthase thioesterase subunit
MKLVLLPFAGGNRYSFRKIYKDIPEYVKIVEYEYPGRGLRSREPLLESMEDLIEDLYMQLEKTVYSDDYIIYGHSLGALAGFLLCRKLHELNAPMPLKLCLSGKVHPSFAIKKKASIDKDEFWNKVSELGALPKELLELEELKNYYEPILRTDFKIVEDYIYQPGAPLPIPIDVFFGNEEIESADTEAFQYWEKESNVQTRLFKYTGNHFFLFFYFDLISQHVFDEPILKIAEKPI